jgi:hypothetical protein
MSQIINPATGRKHSVPCSRDSFYLLSLLDMKKIVFAICLFAAATEHTYAQNIAVNTDGTTAETGVLLDVKGSNAYNTTATQTVFQIKSFNTSGNELKLRLILGTHATAGSRYAAMDVYDAAGAAYRNLSLQPSGGNVGIGLTSPATKLVVAGNAGNGSGTFGGGISLLDLQGTFPNFSEPKMIFTESGNAIASISAKNVANYIGALIFSTNNTSLAAAGDAERMRILGNGNVGIGTTAPGYLLDVAGTINTGLGGIYNNGCVRFGTHTLNSHTGGWLYLGDEAGTPYSGRGIAMSNTYIASALYYPNGSHAAGKVLISDATGLATWGSASGAIGSNITFPDGLSSITAVTLQGGSAWTYTVTAGKNLYITSYYSPFSAGNVLSVGGTTVIDGLANYNNTNNPTYVRMPIIVAAGIVVAGPATSVATGFEVNAAVTPVVQTGLSTTPYTVTAGKTLVILQTYMTGGSDLSISINGGTNYYIARGTAYSNISGTNVQSPLGSPIIVPSAGKVKMSLNGNSFCGYEF